MEEIQLDLFPEDLVKCKLCGRVPNLVHGGVGWITDDKCKGNWGYSYVDKEKAILNWNCNNSLE